jgi:endo-1,4-beta-xylanase
MLGWFANRLREAVMTRRSITAAAMLVAAWFSALLSGHPARASVIETYDFEDGTVQWWTSFNGASTPINTTADAFSGMHSLLTTTNSTGATSGPGISLSTILLPGATYTITGELKLTPGEVATNANFTIKRSDPACSGGTCFDTIGAFQVPVNDRSWAQIGGSYTVSSTETGLFLYAQLIGPSTATSFYLDDVVIDETSPPPSSTPLPAAFPLFAAGFAGLGLLGWRRKRKAEAAA